ncbi:MAG: hypothetical protein JRJ85_10715 [Deltaproteobacteria bacterium]|nr:hypothetical protein [Deltaproteobacteria bacterium]
MEIVKGYHGEWNMGSPGGWEYQRIAQILGKMAWERISETVQIDVALDFDSPAINAVPGFARMMLRAHRNVHGGNPVHAVLLAESETLDVVMENKNFVEYLSTLEGVTASLAGPEHLSLQQGKVCCRGNEATVIFMDFNLNVLVKIAEVQDTKPIEEAIRQGILVNPKGMEPLGAKGLFEVLSEKDRLGISDDTWMHTPWTRQFYHRKTTGPDGETIEDLIRWTESHWENLVLKPAHGYSGHGIFIGNSGEDPKEYIGRALDAGDYIVQQFVPERIWSEQTTWPQTEEGALHLRKWQTDFRCFITDEGIQGFLARFGGIPTNVGSGGGIQPLGILNSQVTTREAAERVNAALFDLGYHAYKQIQEEVNQKAVEMGFTYLLGPIMVSLRPRIIHSDHLADLRRYARNLWNDAVRLEKLWRKGQLDDLVRIGDVEKQLAMSQPWGGSPALMVSDGLFSFGADLETEDA